MTTPKPVRRIDRSAVVTGSLGSLDGKHGEHVHFRVLAERHSDLSSDDIRSLEGSYLL